MSRRALVLPLLILLGVLLGGAGALLAQSAPLLQGPSAPALRTAPPPSPGLAQSASLDPEQRLTAARVGARDQFEAMQRWNEEGRLPARNGFERPLPAPARVSFGLARRIGAPAVSTIGVQATTARGEAWATRIEVADAWRLRLRLDDVSLPDGSRLWVTGANGEQVAFGLELLDPEGNLWTPSVAGPTLTLEVLLPPGAELEGAGFALETLLQLFPPEQTVSPKVIDTSCLQDAQCTDPSDFPVIDPVRSAIGQLQFGGFVCTGSLLNNTDPDQLFAPYLLTANHCFDSQIQASSLEVFFDYFTDECEDPFGDNSDWPSLATLPRVNGSTLLATGASSDYTLVLLQDLPPNRVFLGWTAVPVTDGQIVHRVSHPAPLFDIYPQTYTRYRVDEQIPACIGAPRPNFIQMKNLESGTFGGSSGSPLMNEEGQVLGQLTGACGPDAENGCDFENTEVDGAFSATYPALQPFLDPGPCVPGPTVLCIDDVANDGRFRVTMTYDSPSQGVSGTAQAIDTGDIGVSKGGLFAFINPANPEVLIKVLNGCPINQHYWIFYAATTDLGFEIEVLDTETARVTGYGNVDGNPANLIQDFEAFPCE